MGDRSVLNPRALPLCGALALSAVALQAAPPQVSSPAPPVFESGANRVEVDFVVRDDEGQLIRDLESHEIAVYEDGVRQEIDTLELVETPARPGEGAGESEKLPSAFLAMVFDRLSPAARQFAREAVVEHLAAGSSRAAVGIFTIDRGLNALLPFTEDYGLVSQVLQGHGSRGTTQWSGTAERELVRRAWHGLGQGFGQSYVAAAESEGPAECRINEDVRIRLPELMESRMVEAFHSLERDRQGQGTANALLSLVSGLGALPGRKAVVLFSEGLAMPSGADDLFQGVVAAAHRARVSLYTTDAGGLRVASASDEMRRTLDTLNTRRNPTTDMEGRLTQEGLLTLMERNEDALRQAPASGLTRLADGTGGFFFGSTNALDEGLAAVEEELRTYYLLSYTPRRAAPDGRFHRITVEVDRPHGRLQARKGYLAVSAPLAAPPMPHEARALALLAGNAPPSAVHLRVRGLQFPEEPGQSRVPIVVEVDGRDLSRVEDPEEGVFRQDFTILVLVRDGGGRVVGQLSQRYPLQGPLARAESTEDGGVLFYREARLPPGNYTLQAVVHDALAERAGSATAALVVPPAVVGHLRASSLVVVRRAEKLGQGEEGSPEPLQYDGVVLYPNLGEPLQREPGRELAFFMTAWPSADRSGIDARVEVRREGETVAAAPPLRLEPQDDGRIRLVSSLPVESFAPGSYELRVTLSDGVDAETRSTTIAFMN